MMLIILEQKLSDAIKGTDLEWIFFHQLHMYINHQKNIRKFYEKSHFILREN